MRQMVAAAVVLMQRQSDECWAVRTPAFRLQAEGCSVVHNTGVRRLVVVVLAAVVAVPGAWGAWWVWRATHPVLPDDTSAGWLPAVVVAAGNHGELSEPFGVAVAADGTIFLSDAGDAHAIRRLAPDGTMRLVAGGRRGFADGAGADAAFDTPSHLALDESGNVYVADTGNHAIRRVTPDGVVTTVAGDGIPGAGEGSSAPAERPRRRGRRSRRTRRRRRHLQRSDRPARSRGRRDDRRCRHSRPRGWTGCSRGLRHARRRRCPGGRQHRGR